MIPKPTPITTPKAAFTASWVRNSRLSRVAALFLVVEPVVGHVIEPLRYGHSTGPPCFRFSAADC
jgi:hypothetical protein